MLVTCREADVASLDGCTGEDWIGLARSRSHVGGVHDLPGLVLEAVGHVVRREVGPMAPEEGNVALGHEVPCDGLVPILLPEDQQRDAVALELAVDVVVVGLLLASWLRLGACGGLFGR